MVSRISVMLLGLLAEGERHGYELVREMDERGMLRWTRASKVAAYKALARLEQEGCLTSWTERDGLTPEKRVYALTAEGEKRLGEMVYSLCAAEEPIRFETYVGLYFMDHLKGEERGEALEQRGSYLARQLRRIEEELELLEGVAGEIQLEILRHEAECYGRELRWIGEIAVKIDGNTREPGGTYPRRR